jgi:hypothetical protein
MFVNKYLPYTTQFLKEEKVSQMVNFILVLPLLKVFNTKVHVNIVTKDTVAMNND